MKPLNHFKSNTSGLFKLDCDVEYAIWLQTRRIVPQTLFRDLNASAIVPLLLDNDYVCELENILDAQA